MDLFCGNCGSRMGSDGRCPNCGTLSTKSPAEKAKEKERKPLVSKKTFIKIVVGLSAYTVIVLTLLSLVFFDVINIPFINDIFIYTGMKEEKTTVKPFVETEPESGDIDTPTVTPDDEYVSPGSFDFTPTDANEFYENNSTVNEEFYATDSSEMHSESEAYDNLASRGFSQNIIYTFNDIDGNYLGEENISSYSSTVHPAYRTIYESATGEVWQISEINGSVYALPVGYNAENGGVPIVVSETSAITSYDSTTNKFFVTIPNSDVYTVKIVDLINAETLDSLSFGGAN